MNLLHGNKLSPWEDFFVNTFSSEAISPNQLCTCICMYIGAGASQSICSGTMNLTPGKYSCFPNPLILVPIVYYIGRY